MVRQTGFPTCFALSADLRRKEVTESLPKQKGMERNFDHLNSQKCGTLGRNPVRAAPIFDHHFHVCLREVNVSPVKPIGK